MRTLIAGALLASSACGFPRPEDVGPIEADATVVDAYDYGAHSQYVISSIQLPATNTQAREFGFDLNGDSAIDNQLGMVLATLASMGFDSQTAMTAAIDRGTAIDLLDFQTPDFANAPAARFAAFIGASPTPPACIGPTDTTCRRHLDGNATFSLAHLSNDQALEGPIAAGKYSGSGSGMTVALSLAAAAPMEIHLIGARARLDNPEPMMLATGAIGGAVTKVDIDTKVIPAWQVTFREVIERDCVMLSMPPDCGCMPDSQGRTLIGLFDADDNCSVTVEEIRDNSLIVSLLAPDVTVDGMPALSLGFGFTAVGATFTVPSSN